VGARAALSIHTVQKGESLWSISQKQGTTLEELRRTNYNSLGGGGLTSLTHLLGASFMCVLPSTS